MNPLIANKIDEISELCHENHVRSLSLFGSVTDPKRFNESSDIDLIVSFKTEEISLEDYAEAYFRLTFGLENLLGREIDLVTERSLSNPYFIEELKRTKVEIYNQLEEIDG